MHDLRDVRNFEKGFPVGSIEKKACSEMGIFWTFFEAKSVCYVSFVLGGSIDSSRHTDLHQRSFGKFVIFCQRLLLQKRIPHGPTETFSFIERSSYEKCSNYCRCSCDCFLSFCLRMLLFNILTSLHIITNTLIPFY